MSLPANSSRDRSIWTRGSSQATPHRFAGPIGAGPRWSASSNGLLAFRRSPPLNTQLTWLGRNGQPLGTVGEPGVFRNPRISLGENLLRPGTPTTLFQTRLVAEGNQREYDVSADGQRFLINDPLSDEADTPITVLVNWPKLLQK